MRCNIKQVVNQMVTKYKTRNPYELCDYTNVLVQVCELGDVLGCYLLIKRQKCILLNQSIIGTPLEKVVLAHELGHSKLHYKNQCYFYGSTLFNKNKEENEANKFAAELLIDDDILNEHREFTTEQLSRLLGYDKKFIELRLK